LTEDLKGLLTAKKQHEYLATEWQMAARRSVAVRQVSLSVACCVRDGVCGTRDVAGQRARYPASRRWPASVVCRVLFACSRSPAPLCWVLHGAQSLVSLLSPEGDECMVVFVLARALARALPCKSLVATGHVQIYEHMGDGRCLRRCEVPWRLACL
jgi:hypothetical protein